MTPYCYDSYTSVVWFDIGWMLIGANLTIIGFAIAKWIKGKRPTVPSPMKAPSETK